MPHPAKKAHQRTELAVWGLAGLPDRGFRVAMILENHHLRDAMPSHDLVGEVHVFLCDFHYQLPTANRLSIYDASIMEVLIGNRFVAPSILRILFSEWKYRCYYFDIYALGVMDHRP